MARRLVGFEDSLALRLKKLGEELRVLRQRLSERKPQRATRFSDLYGLWKGKSHFSYQEIKEAEVQLTDRP